MDPRDEWNAQEPPEGFADRVMGAIDREAEASAPRRSRARRAGVIGGLALAAAIALAIGWRASGPASRGDAIAADREQIALGSRAVAVLERGARVTWSGDDVTQPAGDVFYRVEPGAAFRVHTPAGDVQVLGTCFRVKVEESEMNGRDVKAGAIGAVVGAAALVSVYEGKVAVTHAKESVTLTAGESARADERGVRLEGASGAAGDAKGTGAGANGEAASEDPLVAANASLADSVREYKRRLEAIESQKKDVEKQLAEAQGKLAAQENDGQMPLSDRDFDLSQDDWKELAARGEVRAQIPCPADQWKLGPDDITKAGLAPQDQQAVQSALSKVTDHAWSTIRPMCVQALGGNASVADMLGMGTCQSLIFSVAQKSHENEADEMRAVAEIRAGLRPLPKNLDELGSVGKMLWEITGETPALEQDLAQSIGPDDAHRFVNADVGCWSHSRWSNGPRPPAVK